MREKLPFTPFRCVIRTDGRIERLDKPVTFAEIEKLIGAAMTDSVVLRQFGEHPIHVMIVDDLGYETTLIDHGGGRFEQRCTKARKPVNAEATRLYHTTCVPGATHQIVGDVVVVPDYDYETPARSL
ncbi:hypothetical protein VAR608DRAFT_4928 [Variovorax sp. HW608]|uniref:hypothetical protein n=1 Tax=Variovorax sp. HW608 TaxID=1034889 RepID=UPI0008202132|nr:hypothetical protein [Variovorax sp. HW608]SCK49474.1 hypothetical protein VAR608DRAFT_4928 [Variovorax sp. HW608]